MDSALHVGLSTGYLSYKNTFESENYTIIVRQTPGELTMQIIVK